MTTRRLALSLLAPCVVVLCAPSAWAGPTQWQIQPSPNRGSTNELTGVSTTSSTNAWAVGCFVGTSGLCHALLEHYDGTTWQALGGHGPGMTSSLQAVRATSSTNAWAVGTWARQGWSFHRTLIEHYDGTSWKRQVSVSYTSGDNQLEGVAATSASNAWAVGEALAHNGSYFPIIEHYDGTSWTNVPITSPADSSILFGVATPGPSNVWAVGKAQSSGAATQTLVEHYDGSIWSRAPSPNMGSDGSELRAVSAVSGSNVWAVGRYFFTNNLADHRTLIEHYDGTGWSIIPSPIQGTASELVGVKAIAADDVWAVGDSYDPGSGGYGPLIEHYDGTAWTVASIPTVGGSLAGVGGSSASNVFAVGVGNSTLVMHCC